MKTGTLLKLVRSTGEKIDLFPKGPAGVEARILRRGGAISVFVYGSDHFLDWMLHFLPAWGKMTETVYAAALAHEIAIRTSPADPVLIYGHSWGGAVAAAARLEIKDRVVYVVGLGPKRPITGFFDYVYRVRGDIVPFLPPWRKLISRKSKLLGRWMLPWKAHRLTTYESMLM